MEGRVHYSPSFVPHNTPLSPFSSPHREAATPLGCFMEPKKFNSLDLLLVLCKLHETDCPHQTFLFVH